MMGALTSAQMYLDHPGWRYGGWAMAVMMLTGLFWLAVIGVVVWLIVRATRAPESHAATPGSHTASAQQILAERYARGEITTEEYRERSQHLG
jgi:putative membrane protein